LIHSFLLAWLGFPVPERMPGFLLPIYESKLGIKQLANRAEDDCIIDFSELNGEVDLVHLSTLATLPDMIICPDVELNKTVICGEKVIYAFYDGTQYYCGDRYSLIRLLTTNSEKIRDRLTQNSNWSAVAGFLAFCGDQVAAVEARKRAKTYLKVGASNSASQSAFNPFNNKSSGHFYEYQTTVAAR
jgi:hypothetical protein